MTSKGGLAASIHNQRFVHVKHKYITIYLIMRKKTTCNKLSFSNNKQNLGIFQFYVFNGFILIQMFTWLQHVNISYERKYLLKYSK